MRTALSALSLQPVENHQAAESSAMSVEDCIRMRQHLDIFCGTRILAKVSST